MNVPDFIQEFVREGFYVRMCYHSDEQPDSLERTRISMARFFERDPEAEKHVPKPFYFYEIKTREDAQDHRTIYIRKGPVADEWRCLMRVPGRWFAFHDMREFLQQYAGTFYDESIISGVWQTLFTRYGVRVRLRTRL